MTEETQQGGGAVVPIRQQAPKAQITAGAPIRALIPTTLDEAYRLGNALFQSGIVPYQLKTPEAVCAVIMRGMELGMPPMQSLASLMVVNQRVSMFGDAALARVRGAGVLTGFKEFIEGTGDDMVAVCQVGRRNADGSVEAVEERFSVEDAKLAGLWTKRGKSGEPSPWQTYPKRMLKMRARGFALRDLFTDVLGGMRTVEEEQDIERMEAQSLVAPPPPPVEEAPGLLVAPPPPPVEEEKTIVAPPPPAPDAALADDASYLDLLISTPPQQDEVDEYDTALAACTTGEDFDETVGEWCRTINGMSSEDRKRALAVFERHQKRIGA